MHSAEKACDTTLNDENTAQHNGVFYNNSHQGCPVPATPARSFRFGPRWRPVTLLAL